jgi:hypothetical protein
MWTQNLHIRAEGVAQAIESLLCKLKAVSSAFFVPQKKKKSKLF